MSYEKRQLEDIKEQIKELVQEARDLLPRGSLTKERAESYWVAHILMALDKDHDYLGGSMFTMEDTINEMDESDDEDLFLEEDE